MVEKLFTVIFLIEWIARLVAYGWASMFEPFNAFDTILVIGCGVIPQFILPALDIEVDGGTLRTFTALR
jgi:hypothetical protein